MVEDQNLIVKSLKLSLGKKYKVDSIQSFAEAKGFDISDYDLVLLDISLQDGSGLDLYKLFKAYKDIPVIFLTANDEEETIVKAFEMGADDYLTKPFKLGELFARINKVLPPTLDFGRIELDDNSRIAYIDGKDAGLTSKEFELLRYFIINKNRTITRDQLLQLWEAENVFINDNTLTVTINRLRKKIDLKELKTIKNVGYMLDEKE